VAEGVEIPIGQQSIFGYVPSQTMIARIWRGKATSADADAYHRHVTTDVFPKLTNLPGHRGAYLLRREIDDHVEFLAATLWDSMEVIKKFAGNDPNTAVVAPEARAVLTEFDDFATHYDVVYGSDGEAR
jgi:heme-degrading monooxygenase HmoA